MSNTEIQELEPKILQVEANMNNSITISKRTIVITLLIAVCGIWFIGSCSQQMTELLNKIENLENKMKQKDEYMEQREEENRKQTTVLLNKIEKLTFDNEYFKDTIRQKDRDNEHLKGEIGSLKQSGYMDYVRNVGTVAYTLGGLGALSSFGLPAIGVKLGGEAALTIGKSTLQMIGMA
uniref:uncharacterized protein LOC120326361 n=1 Tax=Styela clava TaxID=7725 RepID=UPI00193AA60C|nr:uncharacterized protein LOC120326361 [Styela clava]